MKIPVLGMLLLLCGMVWAATPEGFSTNWTDVQKVAKAKNQPIYLHFTTTWCGWCRKIENETYTAPESKKALRFFAAATLDCTVPQGQTPKGNTKTNIELMDKYGGSGYPFLVVLTKNGELLKSNSGYLPPAQFVTMLSKAKESSTAYEAFQTYAATADKQGYEYNLRGLQLYMMLEQDRKAAPFAKKVLELDPKNEKGDAAIAKCALLMNLSGKDWPDKAKPLINEISTLDPENEKGVMEKARIMLTNYYCWAASRGTDEKGKNANYQQGIATITGLTTSAKKLKDAATVYMILGFMQAQIGKNTEALAAYEKSLAADPANPRVPRLKAQIEQLRKKN